jgi:ABC-type amino acid transport substrate-binding protein
LKKIIVSVLFLYLFVLSPISAHAKVLDKDTIVIGTESTYPPYEFRDEKNNLQGFDIELMESIANKLGKKIEWVDMPFDSLIPALLAHKIDIVAAGMSATPERAKRVAFSTPYEISMSAFLAKTENTSLKTLNDMKGKIIAVQLGTVQETFSRTIEGANVKTFQKFDDCVREVTLGRADATLMDVPVAKKFLDQKDFDGKISIAFEQEITGAGKALAIHLEEKDFLDAVNGALNEMQNSDELENLRNKWFKQ